MIKGSPGAGKSTLAAEVARRLDLTHIELDGLHHGPNWRAPSAEDFQRTVAAAIAQANGRWVIDGNYDSKLRSLIIDQADEIVWLDLPVYVKFGRLARRTVTRLITREELWSGNRETWRGAFFDRDSIFVWFVRAHRRHRREWPSIFRDDPRFVRLRTDAEVAEWLRRLETAQSIDGRHDPAMGGEPRQVGEHV